MMMRVQLITKRELEITGISRYTKDLYNGLQAAGLDASLTFPAEAPIPTPMYRGLKRTGLDVRAFFANYPLRVKLESVDLYHLTGQMLATLLLFQRFSRPVVVSVLDIIPYLVHQDPELNTFRHPVDYMFYRLALAGLRRADALIAISEYTKRTLVDALHLPEKRIHVVYPTIDHEKFRPMLVSDAFLSKYGLNSEQHYVLFVGSEAPRKNLSTLIRAFALVKQQIPGVKLLKVGSSQFSQERRKLEALIAKLDLQRDVQFFEFVLDEDLPAFYNAADVVVMPSLYEGFGLPIVEAMACGTPVVCARAGSLPEVVGDGGVQVYPRDVNALAEALSALLNSPEERLRLGQVGRERASKFTSQQAACETHQIYMNLVERAKT
jgi:glycosyltransferase involved in cell wall biosynthesis